MYGELAEGKRQVGQPKLRFKDNLKATLKSLDVPVQTWEDLASDRPQWRRMIRRGAESAEQHRRATAERKRAARKAKTAGDTTQPPASLKYPICDRHFLARVGLISHMRTHIQPVTMKSWSSSTMMDEHHLRTDRSGRPVMPNEKRPKSWTLGGT